jgi:hypothetical protein
MKVAVITPHYRTPWPWLERCLHSVAQQSVPNEHFLVCDGDEFPQASQFPKVQVIKLPRPHGDCGDAARAVGSVTAIAEGFDAIAYVDSDNWLESHHLQVLTQIHQQTSAAFCSTTRNLYTLDGDLLGKCPEVDGDRFVDTNCMFFTRSAFGLIPYWFLMPLALSKAGAGDRWVWDKVKQSSITRAHNFRPTVNYRTRYACHYQHFGKPVPPGSKETMHISVVRK